MIRQSVKDVYFGLNRWLVLPNTALARRRFRVPRDPEGHYLHLGSGTNYIEGLINVEGFVGRRRDAWLDFRNPLPFADASTHFVWCSHTLEHLFPDEAIKLLAEVRRILKPDGIARIATPDFEYALKIAAGHPWHDPKRIFPDPHGQTIDYLFCDGQHKYAYSFSVMDRFARDVGFTHVTHYSAEHGVTPKQYGKVEIGNEHAGSLVVELMP